MQRLAQGFHSVSDHQIPLRCLRECPVITPYGSCLM